MAITGQRFSKFSRHDATAAEGRVTYNAYFHDLCCSALKIRMLYLTFCIIFARLSKRVFLVMDFDPDLIKRELEFKTSRAGGSGGQHVNKVSSKVLLIWNLCNSTALNADQKSLLADRLAGRVTKHGVFQLEVSQDRSQVRNKKIAVDRFIDLLQVNLKTSVPRIKTRTPKSVVLSRLDRKKKMSQKKERRRWRYDD